MKFLARDVLLVLAAIGLITAATWLRVIKWRYALGTGQHAVGLFFMSKATGNFTPGRLGEFAPMVLRGHRTPRVGAWILYDRIVEILVTVGFGLAGVATLSLLSGPQFFLLGITAILGVAGGWYLFTHRRLFDAMAARLEEGGRLQSLALFFSEVSGELVTFVKREPGVLLITGVTKAMDLAGVWLIFKALAVAPSLGLVAAAKCALAIVSFIPITPNATGVPHGTQAWLMHEIGKIPTDVLVAGIGIEIVVVSVSFWTSFGIAGRFIGRAAWNGGNSNNL